MIGSKLTTHTIQDPANYKKFVRNLRITSILDGYKMRNVTEYELKLVARIQKSRNKAK